MRTYFSIEESLITPVFRSSFKPLLVILFTCVFAISCTKDENPKPTPQIESFSPTSGVAGTIVDINGSGFSTTPGNNLVKFNAMAALVQSSTSKKIQAIVPIGTTTGKLSVTIGETTCYSATDFTILKPPVIIDFYPKSGTLGSEITISGNDFSTSPNDNIVKVNDLQAKVISSTSTEIVAIIPEGAFTGIISVSIGGLTCNSSNNFTVVDFENTFTIKGLYVQFERRGAYSGYYTGELISNFNQFETSLGHTVSDEVAIQLDEMKNIGVNTIALEIRSSDLNWTGGFDFPACNLHEVLGLTYPSPDQTDLVNLVALFDLINTKQIKIILRLVNTHMEEFPRTNNTIWLNAILNTIKDHPALDLVLFEGNTRQADGNGDGTNDQCGTPAEPPLWLGDASTPANYVKWAIEYGISLGIPSNKLSAECVIGNYLIESQVPAGTIATNGHLWKTLGVLKKIFDDLAIPENQRTYAVSFYQQTKCENAGGVPCTESSHAQWAEEMWKSAFEIIGRKGSKVVAAEFGLNKNNSVWTTEQAFESHIQLMKRYGVAGGCFWRWVFKDDGEQSDVTQPSPIKKRGILFDYNPVKQKMAEYYLGK